MQKYTLTAIPAPPAKKKLSKPQHICLTPDGFGIAEILVQQLKALGHSVEIVNQPLQKCDVVILLDALKKFKNKEEAIAINQKIFSHARTVATHFEKNEGIFVVVQDTGGRFGLTATEQNNVYASGMSGLVKTAAQEWPKVNCKSIDLECSNLSAEQLAEKIFNEIFVEDKLLEIGLPATGERVALQLTPVVDYFSEFKINQTSVVVVSGGGRGVTAACLIELAQKIKTRFVLLGRTTLDEPPAFCAHIKNEVELKQKLFTHYAEKKISKTPKQIQSEAAKIIATYETKLTIDNLIKLGSEVVYYPVDIQDKQQLNATLENVRKKWGNITAIIHGAGVLADKLISQKTDEQFQLVYNTKVMGLKNLLELTYGDPLNALILFSSVAGRFGNPGQVDYAMANEVLNKIAEQEQRQRGNSCIVKAINWGPWESGMVTPELKKMFADRGIPILSKEEGTKIFVEELQTVPGQSTEVIIGGPLQKTSEAHVFNVDVSSHSFLKHHTIEEIPVLPACLVMDWFMQAAKKMTGGIFACQHFRVLKGIKLEQFYQKPQSFYIEMSNNTLQLRTSGNALPNYSAELIQPYQSDIKYSEEKNIWPWDRDQIYHADRLFHGLDFQVIESLEHVSDNGGTAIIRNSIPHSEVQVLDHLAFDGILQLAILWGIRMLGKKSLPTAIQKFQVYDKNYPNEKMKCIFQGNVKDTQRFHLDAILIKPNGDHYLAMQGLEMCAVQTKALA